MSAAAPQVARDDIELHRYRLRKALITKASGRDDHDTAASAALDLRIEPMPNQIGDRVETLHSHARPRTS
jgi:hypothetical protein